MEIFPDKLRQEVVAELKEIYGSHVMSFMAMKDDEAASIKYVACAWGIKEAINIINNWNIRRQHDRERQRYSPESMPDPT